MNLIAGYFDRNENSMFKWNPPKPIYTCMFFIKPKTVRSKDQNKNSFISSPAMKTNVNKGLIIEAFFAVKT